MRGKSKWLKRSLLIAAGLVVTALFALAFVPRPLPVDTAPVGRAPMAVTVDEDGVTRIKDRYVVSAPLHGSLARIELQPGDVVKRGGVLGRIVPLAPPLLDDRTRKSAEARLAASLATEKQVRAQVERARAGQEFASGELDRQRSLSDRGAGTRGALEQAVLNERTARAELESTRFGVQIAEYEVEMARAALGRLTGGRNEPQLEVRSPVDGKVLRVHQRHEGVVQAGTPLVEVGDPQALEILVDVLTSDAVRIRPGAAVTIDRWGGAPLDASVRVVEPSAFSRISALGVEEQRVNVVIDLRSPQKVWTMLGDGYRVEARITVWQAADVVQVPSSAVFRHEDGWALFSVEGGAARLRKVAIGERTAAAVQLTSSGSEGARVVLHPSDRIRDGVKVAER
jgi:HlyD family secretion protein